MAKITRETLVQNLKVHEKEVEDQNEAVWNKVMQKFDTATKKGERSISLIYGGCEFSTYDIDYIKERALKEGMRWKWGHFSGDEDSGVYIVLEL